MSNENCTSEELKPCPCCGSTHLETTANVNESNNLGRCGAVWCECGLHMSARSLEEAMARWNARAAVTDEQFAMDVHDGRAWQAVRECRITDVRDFRDGGRTFFLSCGHRRHGERATRFNYCDICGAKVVG